MKMGTNKNNVELGELEPFALLAAASKEAGLDDFGDMEFMEPLTRLTHAIVTEANLRPEGIQSARASMIRCLVNRLRVQQDIKRYPEILAEDVSDPIVITGLSRSGTSKLQRMMSRDPAVQMTPLWLLLYPAPLPGWKRGEPDGRIALGKAFEQVLAQQPVMLAGHPMAALEADEDLFMMEMAFEGLLPATSYHIPSFEVWLQSRSREHFYAYEKILLQYLQWQGGGKRGRPWLLKAPTHLGGLEALVNNFPSATIAHCHRDVSTTIASVVRLTEGYRNLMANDLDAAELGTDLLRVFSNEMASYLKQRERLGSRLRIVDVRYDDIVADPMFVIRSIYKAHGMIVTPEGERAMLGWAEENPQYRYGKIPYSLEDYNLSKAKVEQAFAGYRQRFAEMFN